MVTLMRPAPSGAICLKASAYRSMLRCAEQLQSMIVTLTQDAP